MTERPQRRRRADRLLPLALALGIVVLLATAVSSTIAVVGAGKAQDAATAAEKAANAAQKAIRRTERNAATLGDLCKIARRQRRTLVDQLNNSRQYLRSPAGQERSGLNDFVRAISLPQLKARIENETVPTSCRGRGVRSSP